MILYLFKVETGKNGAACERTRSQDRIDIVMLEKKNFDDDQKTAERDKADPRKSPLFMGSAEKLFQVLHAFDGPQRELPLSQIAKLAALDRSATQRVVHTLETLGYLMRISQSRNYELTAKNLQFGYNYLKGSELVGKASPYLLDLSRSVGETVNLLKLDGNDVVYLARFPGQHIINIGIAVGRRLPALFTASGTAILSRLPPARVEAVLVNANLRALTPQSLLDPQRLRDRIRLAGERGYALVVGETVLGDISVAACITDERGEALAGISISVPTTRWSEERAEAELTKHVQLVAATLSAPKFLPGS